MNCPKCGSANVTVATRPNGFGSWRCNSCNASGSYPPHCRYLFALPAVLCRCAASGLVGDRHAAALARRLNLIALRSRVAGRLLAGQLDRLATHAMRAVVIVVVLGVSVVVELTRKGV